MAGRIDLPTVHEVTGIPDSTLRYWVKEHGWQQIGTGPYGAKLYDAAAIFVVARNLTWPIPAEGRSHREPVTGEPLLICRSKRGQGLHRRHTPALSRPRAEMPMRQG